MAIEPKPLIFMAESVRAIRAGEKTQTRRLVKQSIRYQHVNVPGDPGMLWMFDPGKSHRILLPVGHPSVLTFCPHGRVGDYIYVKETWQRVPDGNSGYIIYAADYDDEERAQLKPWRSPMMMPRDCARLLLRLNEVRVEPVRKITMDDCIAEGVKIPVSTRDCPPGKARPCLQLTGPSYKGESFAPCRYMPDRKMGEPEIADYYRAHYASVWDSMHFKNGNGWKKNPWVWVLTFEVVPKK